MSTAPRFDVVVNVYLPVMAAVLGYAQPVAYWAQAPAPGFLRWHSLRARRADWRRERPPGWLEWKDS
jgi:hypothetical protein